MKINPQRLAALIVGVMTVALVATASPRQSKKQMTEAKQHYALAQEYFDKNEREKAIAELKAAIKLAPEFVEAHLSYLGRQKSQASALLTEYQDYAKNKPKSPVFQYLLAKAYETAGQDNEAEAAYQKTLTLDPEFSWALLDRGKQVLERNYQDREKAAGFFEKAYKKAGDSVALNMALATNLNSVKRSQLALAAAERVLQLDPKHFEAYNVKWRAKLSVTKGADATQDEVTQDAKRLETQYPTDLKALDAAQHGYSLLFDTAEAERVKKAILAINPKFYETQSGARIMTVTNSGKRLEFGGPQAERYFATQRIADPKERLTALEKLAGEVEDPDIKIYFINSSLISAYLAMNQLENAERLAEEMEKAGASNNLANIRMGLVRIYLDRKIKLDLAEQYLNKAMEVNRTNLARYEKMTGQEMMVRNSKNIIASNLQLQARLFLLQNLKDKAFATLTESVALAEYEANTLDLGLLYVERNQPEQAIPLLAKAYSFEMRRKEEAKTTLERIYGEREKSLALSALLKDAVDARKKAREAERAAMSAVSSGGPSKLIGQAAPAWELSTVTGERIRLAALQGKVVLLNFWATW